MGVLMGATGDVGVGGVVGCSIFRWRDGKGIEGAGGWYKAFVVVMATGRAEHEW